MDHEISYEYQVLRYAHDPSSGETLNIGVVIYSADTSFLDCRIDQKFGRLSHVFSGFDGDLYKRITADFKRRLRILADHMTQPKLDVLPGDVSLDAITHRIWPDRGLSYRTSDMRFGVTDDINASLENAYERFVTSQYGKARSERRDDHQVWDAYKKYLSELQITPKLTPFTIRSLGLEIQYDHTYKNGHLYALDALSFDYANPESITSRVLTVLGQDRAIGPDHDLRKIYLLLGKPQNESLMRSYENAKKMLQKRLVIDHEIVEEHEAAAFAQRLQRTMIQQGVMEDLREQIETEPLNLSEP